MKAYLCLGSNLGDSKALMLEAAEQISRLEDSSVTRASSIIETEPYGKSDQPVFLNQVLELETSLDPLTLLRMLLDIETRMGRIRTVKWGPRTIDIDILLMEDTIYMDDELCLPHPDFHRRYFALELLMELDPELLHPVFNKSISELYHELRNGGIQ
jgi:2-amino-4-hydroxy-6-hydroxymethyldihydropteridine diphosphokinase